MKQITIVLTTLLFISCNAKTQSLDNIPTQIYNDCETNTNYIEIYPENIIDLTYIPIDNKYFIEYDDPDAFDYDNLQILDEPWDVNYIIIESSKELFYNLLSTLDSLSEVDEDMSLKDYKIAEITTKVEGGLNYQYKLIKISNNE